MAIDPTTPEGREELRRLMADFKRYLATPLGEASKDDIANAVRFTNGWLALVDPALNALDAIDANDAEIERYRIERDAQIVSGQFLAGEIERLKKEFTDEMAETVHELSSEITHLNAKLTALQDGIKGISATHHVCEKLTKLLKDSQ